MLLESEGMKCTEVLKPERMWNTEEATNSILWLEDGRGDKARER